MTSAISVSHLDKTYASGFQALKDINLDIQHGEIFALLGPNGAGKTTLISAILRHRAAVERHRPGRRPRHSFRLPRGARADRAGAAGIDHGCLRDAAGDHA